MNHHPSEHALSVNWDADELPDGQGSRLLRDVAFLQQENAGKLSYSVVLEAARFAPWKNPLVVADDRLITWAIEDGGGGAPCLHVEIAVEPKTTHALPSSWRSWSVNEAGRVVPPALPKALDETVLQTRAIVGRLFVADPAVPTGDIRRMLESVVAQLDALGLEALATLADPRAGDGR